MNHQTLSDKIAIVTGGTQGIGADISRRLVGLGARVVIAGLASERAKGDALAAELGPACAYVETDVENDEDIDRCIGTTLASFGRIDILVNNACIYLDNGLDSTRQQWLKTLNVNLVSSAIFSQKVAPYLPRGGVIINLGSTGGKFGAAGRALYPASKAGMLQLTKNLAVTLAPRGVRVVAVSPAWTWSPAVEAMSGGSRQRADAVGKQFHPLGRVGSGSEIAAVVGFAASDAASWITGVDIPVDGGFSILGPDRGISPRHWFEQASRGMDA